ncbi:hypothetical protein SAMN02745146_3048 [Hymenobacter daecheongensis DSM 21074]|uniref:Uncharacterized protein n=1 Tax=Hymenobacter daecheongensis DSM 21074 TaxID=1121955 RepID=A0A1M6J0X9_9BACT|nr:hypothetical protein [Hymenobacter daecheongensis]SHJ40302.1 hypothetical protein SAMN02745146_3048 [Hymenobacter daecheongensis DSM 21074]
MTSQQKITVEKSLAQLEALNLNELAKKAYSGKDLRNVVISDFKLLEFIAMFNRAIKQLRAELDRGSWQLMFHTYNDPELGQAAINQQLQQMLSYLTGNYTFDNVLPQLLWLVHYQMQGGFWEKSKLRIHSVEELQLQKNQDAIALLQAEVERRVTEVDVLKEALQQSQQELSEYHTLKQQEFKTITSNQQQSSELLKEIRDFQTEASTANATISGIVEQQKLLMADSKEKLAEDHEEYNAIVKSLEGIRGSAKDQLYELGEKDERFAEILQNATEKEALILSRQQRIDELLGFAADSALGGTFSRRQKELVWPVRIWAVVAIAAAVFALWWVLHIFTQFPSHGDGGFSWSVTLLNVVRTSPAFALLFFAIAQYNKERNLQEEYAFKAAVSMTVTGYSDMIDSEAEKTAMLVSAIQGLYTPPSLGKESTPMIFSTKHLADATKNVVDTATALKTTANDLVSAAKA